MNNYPKITIVTPNYNLGQYLEQAILSVLNQNYPNLEYIIIDGESTDNSVEIIKKYKERLAFWVSESDNGMYDAIQKGFDRSTGEIMGWLNSDDLLVPNGLFIIAEIFSNFSDVKWLQGRPISWDNKGRMIDIGLIRRWNKRHFYTHRYQWIQQESTYWHRELWERAGGQLNTNLRLAGDFDLWLRFFDFEKLYTTSALIGGFRFRTGQLSKSNEIEYFKEVNQVLNKKLKQLPFKERLLNLLFRFVYVFISIGYRLKFRFEVLEAFSTAKWFKSPKVIFFDRTKQKFIKINYRK